MFLRPTDACILLLMAVQTGYSFKQQFCSNTHMPCSQGEGICKHECMTGEKRIGYCHGADCSCCKTPVGSRQTIMLDDHMEPPEYTDDDIGNWGSHKEFVRKSHFADSGLRKTALGGLGARGRGAITDFKEGVRCEFEGNTYADGAEWNMDCMEHKCFDGKVSSQLSDNCCEFEKKRYCDGDTWARFCTIYSCWHGKVDSKDDPHCCDHRGKLYQSGDSWTEGCYDIVCHMGKLQEMLNPSCCEDNGVMYESGQTWTEECDHYRCNNGMVERSDVTTCCFGPGGVKKQSGVTWRDGCKDFTCRDGTVENELAPGYCCEHEGDIKDNGASWQIECDMFTCVNGLVTTVPLPTCCEVNGDMKIDGTSWDLDSCYMAKCINGLIVKELKENMCCMYEEDTKENGETWISGCDKFSCVSGKIKRKISQHCCLVENTGQEVKDGEMWYEGCYMYQCKAPNDVLEMVNTHACCVEDNAVYEKSAILTMNECEDHTCICTVAGCSWVMTDNSTCFEHLKPVTQDYVDLIPDTTPAPAPGKVPIHDKLYHKLMEKIKGASNKGPPTETEKKEVNRVYKHILSNLDKYKIRRVPQIACRYNNQWMQHGTKLIDGCFEISCQGACTCYEMLEHGCCYNNETEHKNEGDSWEENCNVFTCKEGEIMMTNSTSPACSTKPIKGCMYGGKEYSTGETIAYGCSIHQCELSRFVSYPDPTCCVVDGSAYPSGSKWQDECVTYYCDSGLIRKVDRQICKEKCQEDQGCQGNQIEFQIQMQPMQLMQPIQQPQPCQSCCMVGAITVQNGQTWMDNCNAHSCNQGAISTSIIANCK